MCGRQQIAANNIVLACINWEDRAIETSKIMSGLNKHALHLIAFLLLGLGSFHCLAADSAASRVAVSKAIPCSSYLPVMQMRLKHGKPAQVEWARAVNGQMSVFSWRVDNKTDAETSIVTFLSDSGQCSIESVRDQGLDWRVLNTGPLGY